MNSYVAKRIVQAISSIGVFKIKADSRENRERSCRQHKTQGVSFCNANCRLAAFCPKGWPAFQGLGDANTESEKIHWTFRFLIIFSSLSWYPWRR